MTKYMLCRGERDVRRVEYVKYKKSMYSIYDLFIDFENVCESNSLMLLLKKYKDLKSEAEFYDVGGQVYVHLNFYWIEAEEVDADGYGTFLDIEQVYPVVENRI